MFNLHAGYVNLDNRSCNGGTYMALDRQTVRKIDQLARLYIDESEIDQYASELSRILDFVEQMNQVDTEGVLPLAHPQDTHLRLRDDVVTEIDQRELFQKIAPATEAGLYLVPKVIE